MWNSPHIDSRPLSQAAGLSMKYSLGIYALIPFNNYKSTFLSLMDLAEVTLTDIQIYFFKKILLRQNCLHSWSLRSSGGVLNVHWSISFSRVNQYCTHALSLGWTFLNFPEILRYIFFEKGLALSWNCACFSLAERLFWASRCSLSIL